MPQTSTKPARSQPPSVTTRDKLKKRAHVDAVFPSGETYRIRKLNMTRRIQEGDMPENLRKLAVAVASGADVDEALSRVSPDELDEVTKEQRALHDRLVLATIVEPKFTQEDLGTGEFEDDPLLPAVDYDFALGIAQGRIESDWEGRWLWGPYPRARLELFQKPHNCKPDCQGCIEFIHSVDPRDPRKALDL